MLDIQHISDETNNVVDCLSRDNNFYTREEGYKLRLNVGETISFIVLFLTEHHPIL